jgi:tetratricopeptide (TPR) repeat protein
MSDAALFCPVCHAPLDARVLGGLCPRCVSGWMLAESPPAPLLHGVTASGLPTSRQGDYEFLAELGRGGMGIVYRARQQSLDRIVALKLMHGGLSENPEHAARFLREARVAASLRHPGIVAIYDLGRLDGVPFFTMELVEGSSLDGLLADGPVAAARAAELVMIVAQSVAHAHERGVVHRDLKPSNVLLDLDGRPMLADFGLAKDLSLHGVGGATQPGFLIGTPAHMAPEQAAGDTSGQPAVDIYGLGALLYHLVTGCVPHNAPTLEAIRRQIVEETPLAPRTLVAAVPAPLEAIIMRCLAKRPAERYGAAREVADELERFLSGQPVRAMGESGGRMTHFLEAASPRLRAYDLFLQAQRMHDDRGLLSDSMAAVEAKLQDALRLDPRLARAHLLLCELHLAHYFVGFDPSAARLRRAEVALTTAEALGADMAELMRMRGFFLYWGRRDNAAAARAFEQAVKAMPNSADAIYNLALVHRRSGRWSAALAGLVRALELDPRNSRIARETAYTLSMVRDYAGALKVFQVQQVIAPTDAALQSFVLITQFCLDGDLQRAVDGFRGSPVDADGVVAKWRALLLAWQGKGTEAITALPPLLSRAGVGLGEELLLQARVRQLAGDPSWRPLAERGCAVLQPEVAVEHAGAAVPLMLLATFEAMLGERETAVRHADRAVELRVASGDAVLGGVLAGACLIRREPGRLLVFALAGPDMDGRFFAELAKVINTPSAVDPVMLQLDPAFARLRIDGRFLGLLAAARAPLEKTEPRAAG